MAWSFWIEQTGASAVWGCSAPGFQGSAPGTAKSLPDEQSLYTAVACITKTSKLLQQAHLLLVGTTILQNHYVEP